MSIVRLTRIEIGPMTMGALLLWQQWDSLELRDSVLFRRVESVTPSVLQLVVPKRQRVGLMDELCAERTAGHFGAERAFRAVQDKFYWPDYRRSVEVFCCGVCCLSEK